MLKLGNRTSTPQGPEDSPTTEKGKVGYWCKRNQTPLVIASILIIAFLLRFVFAFGISGGTAISGGSAASEHLHTITEIMAGSFFGVDGHLNYPFGSTSPNGPFLDIVLAGFALIFKAFGMTATAAAATALSWSAVIFGVLACIPMYKLTKDITGNKFAAYLAMLFLAICPVVISQTVFSNGTELSFIAFAFLCMMFFMYRGLKLFENPVEGKKPMVYAIIAGIFLAMIVLSTYSFFVIIQLFIAAMAVIIIVNRFRHVDITPYVIFFSVPLIIGIALGAIYYIPAGLWMSAFSGPCLAAIIGIGLCALFAALQKRNWTVVLPSIIVGTIVAFILLACLAPSYFNVIVFGNTPYTAIGVSTHVSLSMTATYFGFVTMWFVFAAVIYRIAKLKKNYTSVTYLFTLVFLGIGFLAGVCSSVQAVVFAPAFAIGFALVMVKWLGAVDFKGYKESFRGATIKSVWKKIVKPVPFLTILAVVFIIAVPSVAHALDASVATNDKGNPLNMGAIGYYVKTDSDYVVNPVFNDYSNVSDKGALVTWLDYSADAATYGKFNTITDLYGKGAVAASNIMLSNSINGGTSANMMLYLITYMGIDNARQYLVGADGMSAEHFDILKDIFNNPGKYRKEMINDVNKYGVLSSGISDENIRYIRGTVLLTDNYSPSQIAHMYDKVAAGCGKNIGYIMVTPSMLPMYYGYSSIFSTLAGVNGYQVTDAYGTTPQFQKTDWTTQYYGLYSLTDAAYNSFVWRGFIGKSPTEAGITGSNALLTYINGLTLSDGTYKATPGFGLANFNVDYNTWYVSYNSDNNATLSSPGWTKMLYTEAIAKQDSKGGLINYLAGYPVFMKYTASDPSKNTVVKGIVVDSEKKGVPGVRVAVIDDSGLQRATVFTNEKGEYQIDVPNKEKSVLRFAIGTKEITGGTEIATVSNIKEQMDPIAIASTSLSGYVYAEDLKIPDCDVILTGKSTGYIYSVKVVDGKFNFKAIDDSRDPRVFVPDTYEISVKSPDGKVTYGTATILTAIGENSGLKITLDKATVTVTVRDANGNLMPDAKVILASTFGTTFTGVSDKEGVAKITVVPGTYICTLNDYIVKASTVTVKKDAQDRVTINAYEGRSISVKGGSGETLIVSGIGYQDAFYGDRIIVPAGVCSKPIFGIYAVKGDSVFLSSTEHDDITMNYTKGYWVSGKLQKSSSDDGTGGMITFIRNGNEMITINATAADGFRILLPEGKYTVYANDGIEVYLGTLNVSGEMKDQNLKMVQAESISGRTCWYTSSYAMPYMPISVKIKDGTVEHSFNIVSNSYGSYQFYKPKNATFEATVTLDNTDVYYFTPEGKPDEHVKSMTLTKAGDFKASVNKITIVNDNKFPVFVDGDTLAPGATKQIELRSSSITIIADYAAGSDGYYYYYTGSVPAYPTTDKISLKVNATKYVKVQFTGADKDDDFLVKPIIEKDEKGEDQKAGQYKKGDNNSYFFEDGKKFEVRVLSADKKKVWYWDSSSKDFNINKQPAIEIKGYVGIDLNGKIIINNKEFEVKSGRYDAIVYDVGSFDFTVEVKDDKDNIYTAAAKGIKFAPTEEKKYNYNFAVVNKEKVSADPKPEEKATVELKLESMTGVKAGLKRATLTFTATINVVKEQMQTYKISAGSAWNTLEFYDSEGKQITSMNLSKGSAGTVKCVGTIQVEKVAQFNENLTVVVSELDGTEVCKGGFKTDENWERTTPKDDTTKISYGSDVINNAEYQYAIKINNKDNYTKTFKVDFKSMSMFPADKWIVMVKYDNKIVPISDNVTVEVKGYSTSTFYVKVTSIYSDTKLPDAHVITEVTETQGAKMSTEEKSGITVSGSTAKVESKVMTSAASTDYDVDGRGMVISKGSPPVYLWIIVALIIIMVMAVVWLGIRRGVFTRKK